MGGIAALVNQLVQIQAASISRPLTVTLQVGRSYSTGNGHSCMGNPGGQVCLWKHVLYTSVRFPVLRSENRAWLITLSP